MNRVIKRELGSIVGGVVGGALGTAALKAQLGLVGKLPEPVRPPAMQADPGEVVTAGVERRFGRALSPEAHERARQATHWIYGIAWATALAAFGPSLRLSRPGRAALAGAALGTGVWAVGHLGWLPRAGVVAKPREQGASHMAGALATHVIYGIAAAIPIFLANRLLRSKSRWR